jgi:methyl-accepting chemotaxis protein
MLGLLVVSMLVAIGLVAGLRQGETRLNDRQVPYAIAVAEAALNAKGVANDQRGYLMSGDPTFIHEADLRIDTARSAFAAAENAAVNADQRQAIGMARTEFEQWVQAGRDEFTIFQAGDHQRAITVSQGPDGGLRKNYEQSLADAQSLADPSIQSASTSVAAASSRSIQILVACLIFALAAGIGIAYWLIGRIAMPVFRLVALLMPNS